MVDKRKLPKEIQDKVYVPKKGETYNVEIDGMNQEGKGFGKSNRPFTVDVDLDS